MYVIGQVKCARLEPGQTKQYKLIVHKAVRKIYWSVITNTREKYPQTIPVMLLFSQKPLLYDPK